jgi:hypothetical protein
MPGDILGIRDRRSARPGVATTRPGKRGEAVRKEQFEQILKEAAVVREWLVPGRCESLEALLNTHLMSDDYDDPGTAAAAQEALGDWFPNERVLLQVRRDCRREADGTEEPWLRVEFGGSMGAASGS